MDATHKVVRGAHDKENYLVVVEMLSRIGDKWTVMVVGALAAGTLRASTARDECQDSLGELTRTLERDIVPGVSDDFTLGVG